MIARRKELGLDRFDEVWNGEYHMSPGPSGPHALIDSALIVLLAPYAQAAGLLSTTAFNLGDPTDFRVPDGGYHRSAPSGVWVQTAAIVVEIVSPDDETYAKFDFYAARGVEEILVVDPDARSVTCFVRQGGRFVAGDRSPLLAIATVDIEAAVPWP